MANPKHKLSRDDMMAFLLGELEDAEQSRIESLFLSDAGLRDELETVKSDLFQAYQSGRLNEQRTGAYEKRFLPASIDKDRKEFKAMLARNEAERSKEAEAEAETEKEAPRAARSATSSTQKKSDEQAQKPAPEPAAPGGRSAVLWVVLALVLLGGGAAAFFLMGPSSSQSAHRADLTLRSFSIRGKSQLIPLPAAKEVQLHLPAIGLSAYAGVRVMQLYGDESAELSAAIAAEEVTVVVRREELRPGRYDLELSGVQASGETVVLGYFSFRK